MYGQIPADSSGTAVPILASFPTGSATLVVLPLDEVCLLLNPALKSPFSRLIPGLSVWQMNTPISAFKGKGQAIMPKTPRYQPCHCPVVHSENSFSLHRTKFCPF